MSKYIIAMILSMFLFIGNLKAEYTMQQASDDLSMLNNIAKVSQTYYKEAGWDRDLERFNTFIGSSYRVSKMFPMYPALNEKDRVLKLYCYGGQESVYRMCFINVNVPGATYAGGKLQVKKYSIDYDWIGLNEINVKWTYEVAKAIQDGRPINKKYASKELREALKGAWIPKDMKLKKIDLGLSDSIKWEYKRLVKSGMKPDAILNRLNRIKTGYMSYTEDDIDSLLIYRVIVELDRVNRGWKHKTYDENLYNYIYKNTGNK